MTKLTVLWKMFIGQGSGNAADGVALSISDGIDDTANFGEEGTGTGLVISFDTYDNAGGEAPAISVKYGGLSEDQIDAGGDQVGKSNVVKGVLVNNQWVDVNVQVTADGKVTVIHNNVKYFDNVPIPGWAPLSSPRVAIGAQLVANSRKPQLTTSRYCSTRITHWHSLRRSRLHPRRIKRHLRLGRQCLSL